MILQLQRHRETKCRCLQAQIIGQTLFVQFRQHVCHQLIKICIPNILIKKTIPEFIYAYKGFN